MLNYTGIYQLDSNVIDDRTDSNSLSTFTNFSHSAFSYTSDDYEVALIGIQFPMSFYSIVTPQFVSLFSSTREMIAPPLTLIPGDYDSLSTIIAPIIDFFRLGNGIRDNDAPRITFNAVTQRVTCTSGKYEETEMAHFRFSEGLANILGFSSRFFHYISRDQTADFDVRYHALAVSLQRKKLNPVQTFSDMSVAIAADTDRSMNWLGSSYDAERPIDLKGNLQHLFVYTDIIKHVPVGNSYAQLLRTFTLDRDKTFGEIDDRDFSIPQYIPLLHRSFDRIEIKIRDRTGCEIPFQSGSIIVTLDFRSRPDKYGDLLL